MSNSTLRKATFYILGAFSGIALSFNAQSHTIKKEKSQSLPVQSIRTMAEIYSQIKANYYKETSDKDLIESAIKGMVSGLDPHSEYMTSKDYKALQERTSGKFGGLGMEVGVKNSFIQVIAPIEDTPAERAGIKSGDSIIKIDNTSTRGMTVSEAAKRIRGKPNTDVVLTIIRQGVTEPIVVKVTRSIIQLKSVRHHLLEPDYGYIRISNFQEHTVASLNKAAQALIKQNAVTTKARSKPLKGLVIDLRDNPGGLLTSAVGVSAAFLPANVPIVSTKGRDGTDKSFKALPRDYVNSFTRDPLKGLPLELKNIPLAVLINSGSASASEVVAGALQDHQRAVIIGVQSFGKGSVQTVLPLSNGSAVKLTTALYYTPNDRSIQAKGITPDIEVKDKERRFESREADLAGHINNPTGNKEVTGNTLPEKPHKPTEPSKKKEKKDEELSSRRIPNPETDEQLKVALDLIKTPEQWQKSLGLAAKKEASNKTDKP